MADSAVFGPLMLTASFVVIFISAAFYNTWRSDNRNFIVLVKDKKEGGDYESKHIFAFRKGAEMFALNRLHHKVKTYGYHDDLKCHVTLKRTVGYVRVDNADGETIMELGQ